MRDGVRGRHGQQDARSTGYSLLGAAVSRQALEVVDLGGLQMDQLRGASSHREELCIPRDYVYALRRQSTRDARGAHCGHMKKTRTKKTQQPVKIAGLLGMEAAGIEPAARSPWRALQLGRAKVPADHAR